MTNPPGMSSLGVALLLACAWLGLAGQALTPFLKGKGGTTSESLALMEAAVAAGGKPVRQDMPAIVPVGPTGVQLFAQPPTLRDNDDVTITW